MAWNVFPTLLDCLHLFFHYRLDFFEGVAGRRVLLWLIGTHGLVDLLADPFAEGVAGVLQFPELHFLCIHEDYLLS